MKLTGLKSYNKKTKRTVFEVIVPGTGSRKRIRKVVYVDGWDDLQEKRKAFRDAVLHPDRESAPPTAIPTLHEYKSAHWESYASRLSPEKRRSDEAILKLHLLPILGNTHIDKITTAHVEDVIAAMKKKTHGEKGRYSNAYINTVVHLLRGILFHAYRRRVLSDPPFAREKLPLLPEAPVQNELTAAERDQLLASFENEQGFREHIGKIIALNTKKKIFKPTSEYVTYYYERFRWSQPLFTAAFFTGLRYTDLRFLKWSSVDLKAGVIRLVMRKTKRAVTIPITPRLREALQECRKRAIVSEYVLVTPEGKPYSKATIMRYFKIAKAIEGIKRRFRFHDQRHTFASILATKGINAFTLRDLLGHTSVRTTERYSRPGAETLAAVERALG